VPYPLTGKLGSVAVHLIATPRGTGILRHLGSTTSIPKKMLEMAGISDCCAISYSKCGSLTSSLFWATYQALSRSWSTNDSWISKLGSSELFKEEWVPASDVGRFVRDGSIKSLFQIYVNSLRIEEPQIVDFLTGQALKSEVLHITQTKAGQRTMFQAIVGKLLINP
jgi:ribosomal protein S5